VVQAAHAALESGIHLPHDRDAVSSLVVCSVPSRPALEQQLERLISHGVRAVCFWEPDLGDEPTALATEPLGRTHRKLLAKLPLWQA
jgi:hypothetical protein